MSARLALSIDLDPLSCYRRIYGLPPPPSALAGEGEAERDPVYELAVPRFGRLCRELGVVGTLFVVGQALDSPAAVAALRRAAADGHELANHSFHHRYDLSRLDAERQQQEIARCSRALSEACGQGPVGFRAPGYLLGSGLLAHLSSLGLRYDSSLLPSPAYQAAKLGVLGLLRALGRQSASILGDPRESFGIHLPYRPDLDRPWRRGQAPLLELPISAPLGLPLTGGLLAMGGRPLLSLLAARLRRSDWVQLELHGVDLLDVEADGLDPALAAERALRRPLAERLDLFRRFVEALLGTHRCIRLCEAGL